MRDIFFMECRGLLSLGRCRPVYCWIAKASSRCGWLRKSAGKTAALQKGPRRCTVAGIVCYNSDGFSSAFRRIMAKTTAAKRALSKAVKKSEPVYSRIVLKLSGESFHGPQGFAIHGETIQAIAREVKDVHALGRQIAILLGGGNIFRGARQKGFEIHRGTGD